MALKVFGKAIIRDVIGNTDISGMAGVINQDADYSQDFAEEKIEAADGSLATILTKRLEEKLKIQVVAAGTAFSDAITAANSFPTANKVITLSGWTVSSWNTTWNWKSGGTVKAAKAKEAMMTLNLERYDGAALAEVTS